MLTNACKFTLILLLLSGLAACGKKGPLYLPDPSKPTLTNDDQA